MKKILVGEAFQVWADYVVTRTKAPALRRGAFTMTQRG
jgi:hypothetical protein